MLRLTMWTILYNYQVCIAYSCPYSVRTLSVIFMLTHPGQAMLKSLILIYFCLLVFAPARPSHSLRCTAPLSAISSHFLCHRALVAGQPGASFCRHRSTSCANLCCVPRCPSSLHNARAMYKTMHSYPLLLHARSRMYLASAMHHC